jgi:hypothetical protein
MSSSTVYFPSYLLSVVEQTTERCYFLELPPDIRFRTYDYVFTPDGTTTSIQQAINHSNVVLTCTLIYSDIFSSVVTDPGPRSYARLRILRHNWGLLPDSTQLALSRACQWWKRETQAGRDYSVWDWWEPEADFERLYGI